MKVRELSRITGVSPATISRMLKNPDSIKKVTRDKIYDILEKKGLKNLLSISIVERIVIVIPEVKNSFYIDLCKGIIIAAQNNNIPCEIFLSLEDKNEELKIFDRLQNYSRSAVIWIPALDSDLIPDLKHCILLNIERDINKDSNIRLKMLCDNIKASEKATQFLLEKGAKSPAIITGSKNLINALEKVQGFRNTIVKNNISNIEDRIFYGDFNDYSSGYYIAKEILSTKKFDAILAGNHILAVGIIKAINELNLVVKKDIHLITFDFLPGDNILKYPITEVVFPSFDMGQEAVSLLLKQTSYLPDIQTYNFSANFFVRD